MGGSRILVVEDEAIVAIHLEMMLTRLGYTVVGVAATGEQAVQLALTQSPDAILMDVSLRSTLNGIQAATLIHQQEDIPIIYQTAYTDDMLVDQAKATDAYAYLTKPVRERELRATLEMALYKHGLEKRIAHLNLVLRAIRDVNQLLTREKDPQNLLDEACRILVNTRDYRCVYFLGMQGSRPEFKSSAGSGLDFLESIYHDASAEQLALLPCTTAVRDGKAVVCRDLGLEDFFLPWRDAVLANGFQSSAAIPVSFGAEHPGVLCVFAGKINMFETEEVDLLEEVAGDITYGMKMLEEEAIHRQAEIELHQSEERFAKAFHANPAGMIIVSLGGGKIIDANQSLCESFGYTRAELIGHTGSEIDLYANTADRERIVAQFREQGRVPSFEITLLTRQGEPRHMLGSMEKIEVGGETCMLVAYHDITGRKQAEAALQESERRYRLISENSGDVIWVLDLATQRFTYVSPSVLRLRGMTPAEVMAEPMDRSMSAASLQVVNEQIPRDIARLLGGDESARINTTEIEQLHRDGTLIPTEVVTNVVQDATGRVVEVIGVTREISERKRAERLLRASEEKYRSLIGSLDSEVATVDAEGRLLFLNENAARSLGGSVDQLVGRSLVDIFPEADATHQLNRVQKVIRDDQGEVYESQSTLLGQARWYRTSIQPIHDASGACTQALINATDITLIKQAQASLEEYNRTLEQRVTERTAELSDLYNNAPCGYHSLDENGVFIRINDTELRWLGYTREELLGKVRAVDLLTPASQRTFRDLFTVFKHSGMLSDVELDMVRKDGSVLPTLLNATAVRDAAGKFVMSRSSLLDHSVGKRAEEANRALTRSLERRTRDLETSNRELEAFAYSVSHDLRAPLRAIEGFSAILQDEDADLAGAEKAQLLSSVRSNARKMDQLITDLLGLARVTRVALAFQPVDMTALARQVYTELAAPEIQEKFHFLLAPLPEASGDETLLRQVWVNLISNALKYTLPKAERTIQIGATGEDNRAVYWVKDSGVGFDEQYAGKLFGVFQRMHSAEQFEGNGIGLALVRRIIVRHGGETWAQGKVGEGATFFFSLPKR